MSDGSDKFRCLEREVFLEALERQDPRQRAEFLDVACGTDTQLRREVEALLSEAEGLGEFMNEPVLAVVDEAGVPQDETLLFGLTEKAGDVIGRYRLLDRLGEGGCGVVYRAEQAEPLRREVALKIIKLGMDTRQVIARFQAERQALALMDHPNIAQVFDAGATETGRPYFVMELVRGIRLTEYCDRERLGTTERLRLFMQVCSAIQHAHQKGIIHRDIKPSNVLVAIRDGEAIPKVIDFGIAKATQQHQLAEPTVFTRLDQFIGTPTYMSPEQAEPGKSDIDTRSDIYSLGVLLYELLTGRTPFDGEALMKKGIEECRRTIREEEPTPPSTQLSTLQPSQLTLVAEKRRVLPARLIETLRGDLDWIVLKAMEKDRARRYATAAALAQDVDYYLRNEPVLARPPSNLYRVQKLIRRHRGAVTAVAGIALALMLGTVASVWQAVRATDAEAGARLSERTAVQLRRKAEFERERAQAQAALARLNEYTADINLAQQALASGNYGRAVYLLRKHQAQPGEQDLRGFEWRYLWQLSRGDEHWSLPNQEGSVRWTAFSPSGLLLALGLDDRVNIWNVSSRTLVKTLPVHALSGAFLSDQTLIAGTTREVLRFETTNGAMERLPGENTGPVALSRDGARLATTARDSIRVWDTRSWQESTNMVGLFAPMAFSSDGKLLAANTAAGVAILDLVNGRTPILLEDSARMFGLFFREQLGRVLAFSPDGGEIVAPRNRGTEQGTFLVEWWNASSGKKQTPAIPAKDAEVHSGTIAWFAFSPDGGTLATASMDHSIRLWDVRSRRLIAILHGHLSEVWSLAFSADGGTLVSGAKDGSVSFWAIPHVSRDELVRDSGSPLRFSEDSSRLAVFEHQRNVLRVIRVATRQTEREVSLEARYGPPSRPALTADLQMLAEPLNDGGVRLRNLVTGESKVVDTGSRRVHDVTISPDGRQFITGGFDEPLRWWDLAANTNGLLAGQIGVVVFSGDSKTLAVVSSPERVEIWDAVTHRVRSVLQPDLPVGPALALSPDGRLFAAATNPLEPEQSIRIWDTTRGNAIGACIGHKQGILSLAFSTDGRTLASASHDNTLKLWNVASQQELLSLAHPGLGTSGLAFSPDGMVLAASQGQPERGIRLYSGSPREDAVKAGLTEGDKPQPVQ